VTYYKLEGHNVVPVADVLEWGRDQLIRNLAGLLAQLKGIR
jgi:hypothetical protein